MSKTRSFAQYGLRAASCIKSFQTLDFNGNGYLEVKDLVGPLASVKGISRKQALEVAQTILKVADGGAGKSSGTDSVRPPPHLRSHLHRRLLPHLHLHLHLR